MTAAALAFRPDHVAHMPRAVGDFVSKFANRDRVFPHDAANHFSQNSSQSLHSEMSPLQRLNNGAGGDPIVSGYVHRNKATLRKEVEQRLSYALTEAIPSYVVPAKTVAGEIGTSIGTVENLRHRVPDAMVTLVMLGRAYPKLGSQVARLMALDAELDPAFQREFADFIRRARES